MLVTSNDNKCLLKITYIMISRWTLEFEVMQAYTENLHLWLSALIQSWSGIVTRYSMFIRIGTYLTASIIPKAIWALWSQGMDETWDKPRIGDKFQRLKTDVVSKWLSIWEQWKSVSQQASFTETVQTRHWFSIIQTFLSSKRRYVPLWLIVNPISFSSFVDSLKLFIQRIDLILVIQNFCLLLSARLSALIQL